ncbi:MAG TPA: exodeoxyribonuclease VII small subunit [Candidatus Ozemobacteraceae bacterium]|mgnify:CR=1 FL=1|nr:exodeoxyribonuclease VII small subunit [Candidatus Ozemobacteraceae bacterium]
MSRTTLTPEMLQELAALDSSAIDAMNYETAMSRLEEVVGALEREGTPLDVGMKLYEVGTLLSRRCSGILDATEARMLQLIGDGTTARETPFDPDKDGR